MDCIACGSSQRNLVESHVISNFIRKRLTGELKPDGSKKFSFRWIDQKRLPKQDLPKPRLMCKECDSFLGANVENGIAELIMPSNPDDFDNWKKLPIREHEIHNIFDTPLPLGVYDYQLKEQLMIEKFALSVAWRALHALAKDGKHYSCAFLNSNEGSIVNQKVKKYLFNETHLNEAYEASFFYWPPNTVNFITNSTEDMPFAWTEIVENGKLLGIAVIFSYWIIIWPIFEQNNQPYPTNLNRLQKLCFIDWIYKVSNQLSQST